MNFIGLEWIAIGIVVLMIGMSRGGLPIAGVTLPLLIIIWPEQGQAARSAVAFMLPLLCLMDVVGIILYRGKPDWSHIKKLLPATIGGVFVASLLFVAEGGISFSDRTLKLVIGMLGLAFTIWQIWGVRSFKSRQVSAGNIRMRPIIYGFSAGITSTIAHAAGPVMQMYFLPTGLTKTRFAATSVYFFFFLNAIKLLPFALLGRFSREQLMASVWILPVIPIGVMLGYLIVRLLPEHYYIRFIYLSLSITSVLLIYKAITEP
jgi:hypothetical protein